MRWSFDPWIAARWDFLADEYYASGMADDELFRRLAEGARLYDRFLATGCVVYRYLAWRMLVGEAPGKGGEHGEN
jgi:hypothetical protein